MCTKSLPGDSSVLEIFRALQLVSFSFLCIFVLSCVQQPQQQRSTSNSGESISTANVNSAGVPPKAPVNDTVTLPVIDAMFADEQFASELRSALGLNDEQVQKLESVSRDAVLSLDESDEGASTKRSVQRATDEVTKIVGDEKARQLFEFVRRRWSGSSDDLLTGRPNAVPTDSRIVVNAPAYRLDVYRDGKLERTFKVGIGYPEFPLPHGLRQARSIIFNPTWTPPDEPWVKGKYAPGKKVQAGSSDNPLGPIKIPVGLPSLIHGGKDPARLGTFASHGCVGLTDQGIEMFAQELASLSGDTLTPDEIKKYQKDRSKTEEMKLSRPVPVELRYETIVVQNGEVHIYRDVYELGTNSEDNLRKVLAVYDVDFDALDQALRDQLLNGLQAMAVDAKGQPIKQDETGNGKSESKKGKITTAVKGEKEIVVPVPQLKGKGYPAPVNLVG